MKDGDFFVYSDAGSNVVVEDAPMFGLIFPWSTVTTLQIEELF
jgi:hypothetical protein